ncbi:hypothetical protein Q9R20_05425 [Microbacterium sp. PRF11]|uniref:hypothetical protein n=1 Tax=Microbacterium sp. PRF11 TaxID=2962593 RepID=UPI002881B8EE|nr:hypothetical protein [Microbacterium sp. PRF11]MDT0116427.1 hypothetical protein [Microbacterium sp. PRF11]
MSAAALDSPPPFHRTVENLPAESVHISSRPDLWADAGFQPVSTSRPVAAAEPAAQDDPLDPEGLGPIAAFAGSAAIIAAVVLWIAGVHFLPGILFLGGGPIAIGGLCFTIASRASARAARSTAARRSTWTSA